MTKMIMKRDGRTKLYDQRRIINAIHAAYLEYCAAKDEYVQVDMGSCLSSIFTRIDNLDEDPINVETIQDIVVEELYKTNYELAECYNDYRIKRSVYRNSKNELLDAVAGLLDFTNEDILTENSNKQAQLVSTQRDLMAGEVSKYISRTKLIPQHLIKAHDNGEIKIHDLDYFLNSSYNCELVNLDDMLQNGTVINKKMIEKPKSLRTAMTIVTQIAAQVASCTYGGQTVSLSHIAPFVRISEERIAKKYENMNLPVSQDRLDELIQKELRDEIRDAVQTFNYQVSTLMTTNGQSPFISVCMYISEKPEYEKETVMLIEEFLKQRIDGMKNEYGVVATQTFPKLLYFLDENNTYPGSEYYWLTKLAAKSTALRMNPDIISVKKMKELHGYAFPPMGCRAFLSVFNDKNGEAIFYGRGNLGVCSINLPYAALESGGDLDKFWELLNGKLELARQVCELRYEKMRGVKASVAPILWEHGAISRLNPDDDILKAIDERGFTVTIGYSGLYETVKYLTGKSHTSEEGFELAEKIMRTMRDTLDNYKLEQPHLRFALYGTPQESTTGWFSDKLKARFGVIEDITDKGWITNSYHVDIRERIDAFEKLDIESELQRYSTGGAVSYIETNPMHNNVDAILALYEHMYETIIYSEINFESDVCGVCKYTGTMDNDPETLDWVCPVCGNRDQTKLSVVRRTCGYLGETTWTKGRKLDIINRVKHL